MKKWKGLKVKKLIQLGFKILPQSDWCTEVCADSNGYDHFISLA